MPKDHDFKRLVRARMTGTGERCTSARAALVAQREPGELAISDRARSLLGQLADVGDDSSLARSMVLHAVTARFFHPQWAVDLVAGVAASDKSAKLRESAADAIAWLGWHWDCDDRRRELPPDVVAKTERHPGQWVVARDGRVVATGRDSKASRRELSAGGRAYRVAPPGTARPRIP